MPHIGRDPRVKSSGASATGKVLPHVEAMPTPRPASRRTRPVRGCEILVVLDAEHDSPRRRPAARIRASASRMRGDRARATSRPAALRSPHRIGVSAKRIVFAPEQPWRQRKAASIGPVMSGRS